MNRGLAGKARTGKTTIANRIVEKTAVKTAAFADPLREALLVMFGCLGLTPEHFEDDDLKETVIEAIGRSPRQLMQSLGTEFGRKLVHPDIWVKVIEARNKDDIKNQNLLVTDIRMDNEAEGLRALGFVIAHVDRPDAKKVNKHSSENGVTRLAEDKVITNDSDLAALTSLIDSWLAESQ